EVLFTTLACDVTTGSGGKVETGGANAIVGTGLGADVRSACVGVVVAVGIGCEVRTWRGGATTANGLGDGVAGAITAGAGLGGDGVPAALIVVDAPAGMT